MTARRGKPIFGVDFSGAEQAGRAVWIAAARPWRAGVRIESCRPAADLPGSAVARADCLRALVALIGRQTDAVFGLDFPFSLPASLIGDAGWESYVRNFARRFPTADHFRRACAETAGGRELKRETDRISRVPFAAYNLRLYRQTYYGIAQVLAPLLRAKAARVLPIQPPAVGKAWLLEICPASTLKASGLYPSYKGRGPAARAARARILRELTARGALAPLAPTLADRLLADPGGDALDSVIAAIATRNAGDRAATDRRPSAIERVEGRVYFSTIAATVAREPLASTSSA